MAVEIKYDIRRGADIYRAIYYSRLRNWISTGKIKPGEVVVWRSGLSGWRKPEELEELAPLFKEREKLELRRIKIKKPRRQTLPQKRKVKKILIVDDEKDLCSLLYDTLSDKKYNVSVANTKRDAITCARRERPDMVFLDLKLPDGDGIKVLSKIRNIIPETIVNIISAYGSEERKEEARTKGAYAFIDKPFTENDILESIRQVNK